MFSRNAGLTLLEVMIAVLILGIGLVGVAGLFPVAGAVQRRTYDDVVARQVSDSVQDLVERRGFNAVDLVDPLNPMALLGYKVQPVPAKVLQGESSTTLTITRWALADRCYPSAMGGDPQCINLSLIHI